MISEWSVLLLGLVRVPFSTWQVFSFVVAVLGTIIYRTVPDSNADFDEGAQQTNKERCLPWVVVSHLEVEATFLQPDTPKGSRVDSVGFEVVAMVFPLFFTRGRWWRWFRSWCGFQSHIARTLDWCGRTRNVCGDDDCVNEKIDCTCAKISLPQFQKK